jgi:tetratricopeptide (TPR) repeat protein
MALTPHGPDDQVWCDNPQSPIEKRISYCRSAVRAGHFDILLDLAELQRIAGNYDAALASIARLTDRMPDIPTGYASTNSSEWIAALEARSEIYAQMGKFDEARADGDEIQHISVDSAAADNIQCWLRAIAGRELEQALDFCNKALERKPHIAHFHDSRGLVYFKLGRFQDALGDYNAALDENGNIATSRFGRGAAKLRLGDQEGGKKDIADAEARDLAAAKEMAGFGVTP